MFHSGKTADEEHPHNTKVEHEGWSDLREKKRGCTDCCCLIPLIGMWIGLTFIGLVVCGAISDPKLIQGNPKRLTHSTDYNGNLCGVSSVVKDLRYGYYLPDTSAVCIDACPTTTDYFKFYCEYGNYTTAANDDPALGYYYVAQQTCMYQLATTKFLNRCIPNVATTAAATLAAEYASQYGVNVSSSDIEYAVNTGSNSGWFTTFLGDLYNLRGYIFGFGMGVTVGIGFLYLTLLRIPHILMLFVWLIVLCVFFALLIGSLLLNALANKWASISGHSHNEIVTMKVFAYAGIIISGLYFCMMIVLRKRINLAVHIIEQAARALESMPSILTVPLIQAIGMCLFLAPWLTYLLYLASSGNVVTEYKTLTINGDSFTESYQVYSYSKNAKYIFLYMLFCWFWTSEFLIATGQLIIALCFASWYFSREKNAISGFERVRWAYQEVGIFHLGTAAFGSLIIAVIKTIRAVIAYLQKHAEKSKNKVLEYILCILQCFVWCLEKIMKFIDKHAYIITAIYGYSFCHAAAKGFYLLLRNILRVAAVNMVSGFLMFIWKFSIPLFTTFLCYLAVAYTYNSSDVGDIIAPLVITFFLSYWVASMFIDIFSMGIETLLFCFIADEEMFEPEQRFADAELATAIHETAKKHAENKGKEPPPPPAIIAGKEQPAVEMTPAQPVGRVNVFGPTMDQA